MAKGKASSDNFRKINLKKKVFCSRGFKKTNVSKFKKKAWKQSYKNKTNVCFICGDDGHWANACPNKRTFKRDPNDDNDLPGVSDVDMSSTRSTVTPILAEGNDYEMYMKDALEDLGFKEFRSHQETTIERILQGKSTLLISSTGSGKSLCYQVPAYLYWKYKSYITLVVSPLISLMEDQLVNLPAPMQAVCLHSGLGPEKRAHNLNILRKGTAQVLFISPEYIVGGSNFQELAMLPLIAFACIDEAHCLSEWSHNFRPSYLQLYRALKEKLNINTFLALTATATYQTCLQITKNLGISKKDIIGGTKIPQNLILSVSRDENKDTALIDLLKAKKMRNLESIIVYCTRREDTVRIAQAIRTSMQDVKTADGSLSWDARAYHAGLGSDERNRVQNAFIKGKVRVVVATIAFGMGINKSNVRAIIHYNLPKSFESYVQEIGRAGRDDSLAYCHLFLDPQGKDLHELKRHIYSNSCDRYSIDRLVNKIFKRCKCDMLRTEEDEVESRIKCPGHEIAIPVDELTLDVDLREESILTLVSFIELNYPEKCISLLPHVYSNCKILSYLDGHAGLQEIAKKCSTIAVAMALRKNKEETSLLEFNYIDVASMVGQESSQVRRELKSLEWDEGEDSRRVRGKARIEFTNLSIRVKAPGNLTQTELDSISEFLYNYVISQERVEINRLNFIYETFKKFSLPVCTDKIDLKKSNQLKETLNKYFSHGFQDSELTFDLDTVIKASSSQASSIPVLKYIPPCDIDQVHRDIRSLICTHGEFNWTPRAVARVLQGIPSPRFPADIWGKVYQFWRSHVGLDFNILYSIAKEELTRLSSK